MDFIKKEIKDHIAYITINRPPANAMNRQLYEELGAAFNMLYDELDDVRIAILTAEGRQFIAGNDLGEIDESGVADMAFQANYFNNCIQAIVSSPVPVIGAVMKVGVLGGMAFLPSMVPQKLGRYMTLTGALIPAEKLEAYGSVHSVVPREKLIEEAEKIAEEAMSAPPLSLRAWKKCVKYIDRLDFASIEHITDLAFFDLMDTEDSKEAVNAFMEKRKPEYKGR